jgi:endonuclease YncB( thermonuclease family)
MIFCRKKIFRYLSIACFGVISTAAQAQHKVLSCSDGDTCRIADNKGDIIKVRLVGIDAPETRGNKKKHKSRQPYSLEAKSFLNSRVAEKNITLTSYGTDAFGRVLGDISINGESVNMALVREGMAECYRGKPPKGYSTKFCEDAQAQAKAAQKGIWSLATYESPKDFRRKK